MNLIKMKPNDEYIQIKVKIEQLEKLKLCLESKERELFSDWFKLFELRKFLYTLAKSDLSCKDKIETTLLKLQSSIEIYKEKGYLNSKDL